MKRLLYRVLLVMVVITYFTWVIILIADKQPSVVNVEIVETEQETEIVTEPETEETTVKLETTTETETETQATKYSNNRIRENVPLADDLQIFINNRSRDLGIDEAVIYTIIQHESNFDENAVSTTGDYGLMQINQCHGIITESYANIEKGYELLSDALEETNGNLEMALMVYHYGLAGAKSYWNDGIYSTTYTQNILEGLICYE